MFVNILIIPKRSKPAACRITSGNILPPAFAITQSEKLVCLQQEEEQLYYLSGLLGGKVLCFHCCLGLHEL